MQAKTPTLWKHQSHVQQILWIKVQLRLEAFGLEACSKFFWGLFKALEQGTKCSRKFLETRLLKRPKSIYSLI